MEKYFVDIMKITFITTFSLLLFGCNSPQEKQDTSIEPNTSEKENPNPTAEKQETEKIQKSPFSIGECLTFHSEILNEDRTLNIYLPQGYNRDSMQKYNVIYLLDGSADEDFIHVSGLLQFATFSWINKVPPSILVGIANVDRKRDFTYPTTVESDKIEYPTTGESEKFIRFIEKEVFEIIDSSYKTNHERCLIGQSLGGLLATEILYKKPEMFDHYIIVSPSLWWDKESLLRTEPVDLKNIKSVFIGVGNEEAVMQKTAKELHKKMQKALPKESELRFKYYEKQDHADVMHLAIYEALMEN